MERTTKFARALWISIAAASLGFGASAHAVKIDGEYSVSYAKETITKGSERTVTGSGKFYDLAPAHMIAGPADIVASEADTAMYEVLFTLQNMVFSGDAALGAGALTRTGTGVGATAQSDFALSRGGAVGDNYVMFAKQSTDNSIGKDDTLTLTASFSVTADGPGGITRTVTNKALPSNVGLAVSMTHTNPDAVKVVTALKEMVTLPAMPVVDASDDFMSFTGGTTVSPRLYASLGTLTIGVESGVRDARVVSDTVEDDGVDETMVTLTGARVAVGTLVSDTKNTGIIADGVLDDASDTAGSVVTFSGDYSFIKTLALVDADDCSGTLSELRKPSKDDRTVLTDDTMPRAAGVFDSGMKLCVAVDGETPIPDTDAYVATTEYKGPTDNMFPPVGGTHNLAMITRGGTTVYIPLLNLHENYNHRVVLRNRSGRMVDYDISFNPEDGTTATPGPMASGMLDAGKWVFMKASDIVTLSGNQRTSATLTSDAPSGKLDVSTSLTNLMNRTTDTETH